MHCGLQGQKWASILITASAAYVMKFFFKLVFVIQSEMHGMPAGSAFFNPLSQVSQSHDTTNLPVHPDPDSILRLLLWMSRWAPCPLSNSPVLDRRTRPKSLCPSFLQSNARKSTRPKTASISDLRFRNKLFASTATRNQTECNHFFHLEVRGCPPGLADVGFTWGGGSQQCKIRDVASELHAVKCRKCKKMRTGCIWNSKLVNF